MKWRVGVERIEGWGFGLSVGYKVVLGRKVIFTMIFGPWRINVEKS